MANAGVDEAAPASPPIAIPTTASNSSFFGSESGGFGDTAEGGVDEEYGSEGGEARRRRQLHCVFRSALDLGGAASRDYLLTAPRADGARITRRAAGEERAPRRRDSAGSPRVGLGLDRSGGEPGMEPGHDDAHDSMAMQYLARRMMKANARA